MTRPAIVLLFLCACLAARAACAAGTPAGTSVVNRAQVSYTLGGVAASEQSNDSIFSVAEILDVNVVRQSAPVSVIAGESRRAILFLVTNVGNGSETLPLAVDNLVAGDDFDPLAASVYFDSDASGDLSAADVAYVAGSNDPMLAADAAVSVLVVNDIPANLADGALGRTRLVARAATGNGAPGTSFAGQGAGGTDAVAGASGALANATGDYVIGDVQVALSKSALVTDPAGGGQATPGARIEYRIVVNVSGSGTARALDVADLIPVNTTYVAGSLRLNGSPLTDAQDADGGEFQPGAAPRVRVALGDMTQASGAQTVAFAVTIN
ncbi:MAG TPA: hypothetical protein VFR59_12625 [Steroidobacteraceae bacterium]|nr:hypothetical protein [Steroidobacteraceae bacterium]